MKAFAVVTANICKPHATLAAAVVFCICERGRFCCQGAGWCLYLSKQNLISTRYRKNVYGHPDHALSTFISSVINCLSLLTYSIRLGSSLFLQPISTTYLRIPFVYVNLYGFTMSAVTQPPHKPNELVIVLG